MLKFMEIKPADIERNVFELISNDWFIIAAACGGKTNAMTASWAGLGRLWNKDVVFLFVRPQRYTNELMESADNFSVSVFNDAYRDKLNYLGTVSGRDEDKITKSGFTLLTDEAAPYFTEADITIFCRKLYMQKLEKDCFAPFAQDFNAQHYPMNDHHFLYIGEITKVFI